MASDALKIEISLPPRELSPNHTVGSRGGRLGKSRKVKAYREAARWLAMYALAERGGLTLWPAATARCTFYHRDRRRRDRDNLLASLKSAFDGLVDAGVLVDDAGLTHLPVVMEIDRERPRVEIEVWPVIEGGGDE